MKYNEYSIRIRSEEEAAKHSPFGIAYVISNKYPSIPDEHVERISEALFITGIDVTLYERRYCSPAGSVAPDSLFTTEELNSLHSLLEAFKSISK